MSKDFFSEMVDRIWDSWTSVSRGLAGEKLGMTKLALQQLYDWFIRRAEEKGIKWQEIDFEHELDSTLSYDENKRHLAEIMGVSEEEPKFEPEPEPASLEELLERAGITLPDVNSPYYQAQVEEVIRELTLRLQEAEKAEERAKKVEVIGRDVHGKPRRMTMSVNKLIDMIGDLNNQATKYEEKLAEETAKREEAEKRAKSTEARQFKILTVKFKADMPQFIGADTKRYGPYRAGDVAQLPEGNAAVLVERGMAELWRAVGPAPPPVPPVYVPPPKPVEPRKGLTADQVRLLRAKFNVALMDELGRVPPNASSIFIVKLDEAKGKSYDETLKYILDSVKEIVGREVARKELAKPRYIPKEKEPTPTPAGRLLPYQPPKEEGDEDIMRVPYYRPSQPIGPKALLEQKYPRAPTREEADVLWEHFRFTLAQEGYDAEFYHPYFTQFIEKVSFPDWRTITNIYDALLKHIKSGIEPEFFFTKVRPIIVTTMPFRKGIEEREYDAISFLARAVANAYSGRKARKELDPKALATEMRQEFLEGLFTYGIFVPPKTAEEKASLWETIIETLKKSWAERSSYIEIEETKVPHWFMFIDDEVKTNLDVLVGEPL